jgi:hypothetical protein
MTLALITYRSGPPEMERETSAMFFYVGGIAAITLVVNAITSNTLLNILGMLAAESAEKGLVKTSIMKKLRRQMLKAVQELALEFDFNEKELDEVRSSVSLLHSVSIDELMSGVHMQKASNQQRAMRKSSMRSYSASSATGAGAASMLEGGNSSESLMVSQVSSDGTRTPPDGTHAASAAGAAGAAAGPGARGGTRDRHKRRFSFEALFVSNAEVDDENEDEAYDVIAELEAGNNVRPAPKNSNGPSSPGTMNMRLSLSGRGPMAMITPALLAYVRATFLSMVRVHYWHDIEQGKLPRKSKSGKFLLYSIDVALDEVNMESGGRDWICVEAKLDSVPHNIYLLTKWEEHFPENWCWRYPSRYLNRLECTREERTVYILTSFIAAHEKAQLKIHGYLKTDDDEDDSAQSPEELKVIAESKLAVRIVVIIFIVFSLFALSLLC